MTEAKLHHYVPRFLLRRFSPDQTTENPPLWRLDKKTGHCSRSSVKNEAAVTHYNRLESVQDMPQNAVEDTLAMVDGLASGITADLVEGRTLEEVKRLEMALFVYLQHQRTPRGRHWLISDFEQAKKLDAMRLLLDAGQMREFYGSQGEEVTLEEATRRGQELAHQLDSGRLELKAQHDHAVGAMFIGANDAAVSIGSEMTWVVFHSRPGEEFVLSDHPVLIHDPTAGPDRGAGWLSSDDAEVTLALDPHAALVLSPGRAELHHLDADKNTVEEINLRTYASAEWSIYGRSQGTLQDVRAVAKRDKQRLARLAPKPPILHIQEFEEGSPRPVDVHRLVPKGEVKRRQRWPRWDG